MTNRARAGAIAAACLGSAGVLAYGVRGRSSTFFGPSVYRGSRERKALALTFDDGPSESTPHLLEILDRHRVPATFFQCGANIRRLPEVAISVREAGHEIGNHSDTHPALYLRTQSFIEREFSAAQQTISQVLGFRARLMRPPFGARWFGFRAMQESLGLLGVMWTVIASDWKLDAQAVAQKVLAGAGNGSIVCLHDGRELAPRPDIRSTLDALKRILPALMDRGFEFRTVSQLICLTT